MLSGLQLALGFLTRLPVGQRRKLELDHFAWALFWFPLVGGAVGFVVGVTAWGGQLANPTGPLALAVLLVGLWVWLTGALHLDGLADVVDGLSAWRGDRERALRAMRDSRIGAHGATALVIVLLLKVALLVDLLHSCEGMALVVAISVSAALARFYAALVLVAFPYARREGLGASFKRGSRAGLVGLSLVWPLLLLTISALIEPASSKSQWLRVAFAGLLVVAVVLLVAWWMSRRLGGLTGDAYGAVIELSEVLLLLGFGMH